jgi:hypothetical protein
VNTRDFDGITEFSELTEFLWGEGRGGLDRINMINGMEGMVRQNHFDRKT